MCYMRLIYIYMCNMHLMCIFPHTQPCRCWLPSTSYTTWGFPNYVSLMALTPSHWWLVSPSLQNGILVSPSLQHGNPLRLITMSRASSSPAPSILPTSLSHNHHFPANSRPSSQHCPCNSSPSLHNRQFFPRNSCSSHRCQVGHLFPLGLPSLPPSLPSWLPANSLGYYSHLHHNHFQCFLSMRLAWPCNQRYTGPVSLHQSQRRCRLGGQW